MEQVARIVAGVVERGPRPPAPGAPYGTSAARVIVVVSLACHSLSANA